ncbi:hypothetical protein ACOSQ2_031446 [Xanthoceras sorbifolium]
MGESAVKVIHTIYREPHFARTSNKSLASHVHDAYRPVVETPATDEGQTKQNEITNITFTSTDMRGVHWPYNDIIVIKAIIGGIVIHQALVDNGSLVNILYKAALEGMGLSHNHLKPARELLYSFTRDSITPLGSIILPFTLGEPGRMATFLVINQATAYNAILGRPVLNDLKVVTSTKHLTLKFPTPMGIESVYGDQKTARACYDEAIEIGMLGKKKGAGVREL